MSPAHLCRVFRVSDFLVRPAQQGRDRTALHFRDCLKRGAKHGLKFQTLDPENDGKSFRCSDITGIITLKQLAAIPAAGRRTIFIYRATTALELGARLGESLGLADVDERNTAKFEAGVVVGLVKLDQGVKGSIAA